MDGMRMFYHFVDKHGDEIEIVAADDILLQDNLDSVSQELRPSTQATLSIHLMITATGYEVLKGNF
ncbi:hypothetical protein M8C21_021573 [Ambrosia artemisiifolia]|uniref:Uncharacterized protein n=1 Tax=Ambrosia artemisiifolia TaxID=4212 RepID=A0AAD5BZB5_AMBAR|nr:hypothetical protein M8C21_021573 [Ambrosia artemisiifolia]